MRLHNLAEACEQLERTDSRRAKVEIVASLLAKAKRDELESVVRLLQAELRPPYEGVETGLGEQLLVDAIVTASGASRAVIERQYRKAGDLGLVAQAYAPAKPAREPTVHTAYTELLAIAHVSGSGSVARKVALMAKLLRRARGSSAKLVTRVAQGRLRLGLGDETLLEAAAVAALKDRALKSLLEHAYNVRSDLAGVIHLAFVRGKRGLEVLGSATGHPRPPCARSTSRVRRRHH